MARLEGACEQIDKRLASLERQVVDLRADTVAGDEKLNQKLDAIFPWVIGTILINWVTVILAIHNKH